MKALAIALAGMAWFGMVRGEDLPFKVHHPSDPKGDIGEEVRRLIAHFEAPRPPDFISHPNATKNLKWRVGQMNIISEGVVAVAFNEGHIEVIGIYVRNYKERAWELKSEIHGTFKVRRFADDSIKTTK